MDPTAKLVQAKVWVEVRAPTGPRPQTRLNSGHVYNTQHDRPETRRASIKGNSTLGPSQDSVVVEKKRETITNRLSADINRLSSKGNSICKKIMNFINKFFKPVEVAKKPNELTTSQMTKKLNISTPPPSMTQAEKTAPKNQINEAEINKKIAETTNNAIKEIKATELTFNKGLKKLIDLENKINNLLDPNNKTSKLSDSDKKLFQEFAGILKDVHEMDSFSTNFLMKIIDNNDLKETLSDLSKADFSGLKNAGVFKQKCDSFIDKASDKFKQKLGQLMGTEGGFDKLELSSLTILPTQRGPRYALFAMQLSDIIQKPLKDEIKQLKNNLTSASEDETKKIEGKINEKNASLKELQTSLEPFENAVKGGIQLINKATGDYEISQLFEQMKKEKDLSKLLYSFSTNAKSMSIEQQKEAIQILDGKKMNKELKDNFIALIKADKPLDNERI